ncbi:MAG: hypothetical protein AAGK21_12310 [Bacteroidota bacterium]
MRLVGSVLLALLVAGCAEGQSIWSEPDALPAVEAPGYPDATSEPSCVDGRGVGGEGRYRLDAPDRWRCDARALEDVRDRSRDVVGSERPRAEIAWTRGAGPYADLLIASATDQMIDPAELAAFSIEAFEALTGGSAEIVHRDSVSVPAGRALRQSLRIEVGTVTFRQVSTTYSSPRGTVVVEAITPNPATTWEDLEQALDPLAVFPAESQPGLRLEIGPWPADRVDLPGAVLTFDMDEWDTSEMLDRAYAGDGAVHVRASTVGSLLVTVRPTEHTRLDRATEMLRAQLGRSSGGEIVADSLRAVQGGAVGVIEWAESGAGGMIAVVHAGPAGGAVIDCRYGANYQAWGRQQCGRLADSVHVLSNER